MKTSQLLSNAKSLISDPAKWKKGNNNSKEDFPCCSLNALAKSLRDAWLRNAIEYKMRTNAVRLLEEVVAEKTGHRCVAQYNDRYTTTHSDIMEMFDMAIKSALYEEAQEAVS